MSAKLDAAKALADARKAVLDARIGIAKQSLAPRALAIRSADAVANRVANVAIGLKPAGRIARVVAPLATLAAIGVAVALKLRDQHTSSLAADSEPDDGSIEATADV